MRGYACGRTVEGRAGLLTLAVFLGDFDRQLWCLFSCGGGGARHRYELHGVLKVRPVWLGGYPVGASLVVWLLIEELGSLTC